MRNEYPKMGREILEEFREDFNSQFEEDFERYKSKAEKLYHEKRIEEEIEDFTLRGGKRVRPWFMKMGYVAVEGELENEANEEILRASQAIELEHAYFLIHDDLIDQDDLRRGKPTVHRSFEYDAERKGYRGAEKFGESMGVLAGDLAGSYAEKKILDSDFDRKRKGKALYKLLEAEDRTVHGEVKDLKLDRKEMEEVEEDEIFEMYHLKTGFYTCTAPLEMGAILAGATQEQLTILEKYGKPVGLEFQLQDDLLGLYGDEEKLGKPVGSDLEEGKKTLPVFKAWEEGDEEQKRTIKSTLGREASREDVGRIREIVRDTGALDYAQRKIEELTEEAVVVIENAENAGLIEPEAKYPLKCMPHYFKSREV